MNGLKGVHEWYKTEPKLRATQEQYPDETRTDGFNKERGGLNIDGMRDENINNSFYQSFNKSLKILKESQQAEMKNADMHAFLKSAVKNLEPNQTSKVDYEIIYGII